MENSMSRILIETTVRQTLKGLKENPKRSIRNLVDMALNFSESRFQSRFFQTDSTMLEHEESAYYTLVEDAVNHIETEHLVKFGMNLGYNSCTWGAQRIRMNEKRLGFNIPWTVLFQMDDPQYSTHLPQYDLAIQEGEQLGIYSWILLSHSNPMELFPLIKRHSDSAFFLFCRPENITPAILDEIIPLKHLMPVVRWESGANEACTILRNAQLPYSVYYPYSQKDLQFILNGELFCETQQTHPLFTALAAKPDCPANMQHLAHQAAIQVRTGQSYATMTGAVIAFTALIPVAGAYIGAGVGAFMILTVSPAKAIIFLIFIVILQQLEGNLIYPRVVGSSLGLPAIWVLTAVTLGSGLMGIPGMLLCVPLAAALYRLVKEDVNRPQAKECVKV